MKQKKTEKYTIWILKFKQIKTNIIESTVYRKHHVITPQYTTTLIIHGHRKLAGMKITIYIEGNKYNKTNGKI